MKEYIACCERVFPCRLDIVFMENYRNDLFWLRCLLERLGREATVTVWRQAFQDYDASLFEQILSMGWLPCPEDTITLEQAVSSVLSHIYPTSFENVSSAEAQQLIEETPQITLIRQHFPTVRVECPMTAYHAIHLLDDGVACLAEALIERHGKAGEFIAYDIGLANMARDFEHREEMSVAEALKMRLEYFRTAPKEPHLGWAQMHVEVIRGSETEVVTCVRECEAARYFLDHHPQVGYLMGCSRDNATYQWYNKNLRLQRTTTIMEGFQECDFRVYTVEGMPEKKVAKNV